MFLLLIFLTLVNISCGGLKKFGKQETIDPLDAIIEKRDIYLELIKERQDGFGFVESDRCDSLLFSGLAASSGVDVDLLSARDDKTHQWYRTPSKDCFNNQREDISSTRRSSSTISRDMFAGVMWGLYSNNLSALEELRQYGKSHKWIMGEGLYDRTYMTLNMQDTLYRLVGKSYKGLPYIWIDPIRSHQRHVVALNILLRGKHEGYIDEGAFDLLEKWRDIYPANSLYQFGVARYSDGDQSVTISGLDIFPGDRLPDNTDWASEYLWARDPDGSDWQPDDKARIHSGVDFLFISSLLIDSK